MWNQNLSLTHQFCPSSTWSCSFTMTFCHRVFFLRAKQECLLKMLRPLSSLSWRSLAVIQGRKNCIPVYFISPLLIVCFNKLIVICESTLVVQEKDLMSYIRLKVTTSTYCMIKKKGKLTKAWHWFLIVFKKHTYFTAVTPFLFIFELIRKANV